MQNICESLVWRSTPVIPIAEMAKARSLHVQIQHGQLNESARPYLNLKILKRARTVSGCEGPGSVLSTLKKSEHV